MLLNFHYWFLYAAPSGPPTNVAVTAVSSTSILITWQSPKEFDANGILTWFLIILTDSMGNERNFTLSASTFSLQLQSKLLISTA